MLQSQIQAAKRERECENHNSFLCIYCNSLQQRQHVHTLQLSLVHLTLLMDTSKSTVFLSHDPYQFTIQRMVHSNLVLLFHLGRHLRRVWGFESPCKDPFLWIALRSLDSMEAEVEVRLYQFGSTAYTLLVDGHSDNKLCHLTPCTSADIYWKSPCMKICKCDQF